MRNCIQCPKKEREIAKLKKASKDYACARCHLHIQLPLKFWRGLQGREKIEWKFCPQCGSRKMFYPERGEPVFSFEDGQMIPNQRGNFVE